MRRLANGDTKPQPGNAKNAPLRAIAAIAHLDLLTLGEAVARVEPTPRTLFADLNNGSAVIVLGAKGNHYEEVYRPLTAVAKECGLRLLSEVSRDLGKEKDHEAERIIKRCQYDVFKHMSQLAGPG